MFAAPKCWDIEFLGVVSWRPATDKDASADLLTTTDFSLQPRDISSSVSPSGYSTRRDVA